MSEVRDEVPATGGYERLYHRTRTDCSDEPTLLQSGEMSEAVKQLPWSHKLTIQTRKGVYCARSSQSDDDGFGAASVVCCQSMLILYMGKHK